MSKTVFLPQAKVTDEFLMAVEVAATLRRMKVTDLIREALEKHPDVQKQVEIQGVEPLEIYRGGDRRAQILEKARKEAEAKS